MRIIGGQFKGKKLQGPPESANTRPLPAAVKGALFNILRGHWEGARVLDGFAGTGTFGLEAISRGAEHVAFVEKDRAMLRVLERNIGSLRAEDRADLVAGDALGPAAIARCPKPADIVFFDPPYPMVRDPEQWPRVQLAFSRLIDCLADTGFACLRTPWPLYHVLPEEPEGEAEPASGSSKRAKPEPEIIEIDGEEMLEMTDEELDALDAAEGWGELLDGPGKKAVRNVDVSLKLDNADGPETHVYRNTALHLYMKQGCG